MPRRARIFQQAICYHIMNRGVNRQDIFEDDTDRQRFLDLTDGYKKRFNVRIYHWALMSNHYHFLIAATHASLRPFVGGLQQAYAQFHHARHQSSGVFWQGRFKSKPVEPGAHLVKCGRYIERNPVRAGMLNKAWDYPWSSARFYVDGRFDGFTDFNGHLGQMTERDRRSYADILMLGTEDDWVRSFQARRVIGEEAFAETLRTEWGRHRLKRGRRDDSKAVNVSE